MPVRAAATAPTSSSPIVMEDAYFRDPLHAGDRAVGWWQMNEALPLTDDSDAGPLH